MLKRELTMKERATAKTVKIIILVLILFAIFLAGCCVGPRAVPFWNVIKALFGDGTDQDKLTVLEFRLPRLVLALLIGIGMGASGVIMQNLLHNDLASPGTLGVADGSSLFVTLYVALLADKFSAPIFRPIFALVGGVLSAVVIYTLGTKRKKALSSTKLIMTGVAMGACYSAASTFLMYIIEETRLESLQRWQAGELWGTQWNYILILAIWLAVFGFFAMAKTKELNAINIGYDVATGLGINVKSSFTVLAFIAVGMSSASVAFGGNFFFLGLIGPHIARRLVGTDTRFLIPCSGVTSAIIVITANILVEDVVWFMNIPTGIFVSIIAVPYFIYLLLKTR